MAIPEVLWVMHYSFLLDCKGEEEIRISIDLFLESFRENEYLKKLTGID